MKKFLLAITALVASATPTLAKDYVDAKDVLKLDLIEFIQVYEDVSEYTPLFINEHSREEVVTDLEWCHGAIQADTLLKQFKKYRKNPEKLFTSESVAESAVKIVEIDVAPGAEIPRLPAYYKWMKDSSYEETREFEFDIDKPCMTGFRDIHEYVMKNKLIDFKNDELGIIHAFTSFMLDSGVITESQAVSLVLTQKLDFLKYREKSLMITGDSLELERKVGEYLKKISHDGPTKEYLKKINHDGPTNMKHLLYILELQRDMALINNGVDPEKTLFRSPK